MISKLKSFIGNNKFYKEIKFWKDVGFADFFSFEKLWLFKKVYPYTMSGYKRLSNVYELAKKIEKKKINGAFVECGVWKGGCTAIMAFVSKKAGSLRKVWLFDSFEGLPEPTYKDGLLAREYAQNKAGGNRKTIEKCIGPIEYVNKILFDILRINRDNIIIKKGWFQNTLLKVQKEIGPISILRLDGDWYESTKCCLENLYDNVIIGGYIIVDDYGHWEGARKALEEFFISRKIKPNLIKIDYTGIYFQKP